MKVTRDDIMGMPVTVEIIDNIPNVSELISEIFEYFKTVDEKFSTYKENSEISKINSGEINVENYSAEVKEVLRLAEQTKRETSGYFDIVRPDGKLAPLGLVKGWAINNAARLLSNKGVKNFYINAGGDIQAVGKNAAGEYFKVGIENPFKRGEIIKVVELKNAGLATSGTYIRGQHIYNPHKPNQKINDIISLTVVGPNIYEADRFATAAFAMGKDAVNFLETLNSFEAYMVDSDGIATMTSSFERYVV